MLLRTNVVFLQSPKTRFNPSAIASGFVTGDKIREGEKNGKESK
jgi:hypothetical protein